MGSAQNAVLDLLEKKNLFPHLLSQKFPHVLAKIVATWESPGTIDAYFEELMLADPRRKQGFPEDVMTEIFALSRLHDITHEKPASSPFDIWSRSEELSNARARQTDNAL